MTLVIDTPPAMTLAEQESKIEYILYQFKYCSKTLDMSLRNLFDIFNISAHFYIDMAHGREHETQELSWYLLDYKFHRLYKFNAEKLIFKWLSDRSQLPSSTLSGAKQWPF